MRAPIPVYSVTFSPDGKRVAVGGYKRVTLYDTETGKPVAQYVAGKDAIHSVVYSADGKQLAAGSGVPAVSGSVAVLDAGTGKPIRTLDTHEDAVESVAFAGNQILSAADDETVEIADGANGKVVGTLREHVGRCLAVVVPPKISDNDGGNIFITGGADNLVKVWDAEKRRVVINFDQAQGPIWSISPFVRPGRFLTGSGDGHLRWYGVYTERERQLPNGDKEPIVPPAGEPQPRGGYVERDIAAHEGGVYSVAAAPNDQFIATGGADGKVILWNLGGGKLREFADSDKDILSVAISPDSKRVAAAALDGRTRVYDVEKGTLLWTYPALPPDTAGGLSASYFNNRALSGEPILKRVDNTVDFAAAPTGPGVNKETISVRWEGFFVTPASGTYTFGIRTDDGGRLWIDGKSVIDSWVDRGATDDTAKTPVKLRKGQRVPIKMEYFQGGGGAEAHLLASRNGQPMRVIPAGWLAPLPPAKPEPPKPLPAKPTTPAAPALSKPKL